MRHFQLLIALAVAASFVVGIEREAFSELEDVVSDDEHTIPLDPARRLPAGPLPPWRQQQRGTSPARSGSARGSQGDGARAPPTRASASLGRTSSGSDPTWLERWADGITSRESHNHRPRGAQRHRRKAQDRGRSAQRRRLQHLHRGIPLHPARALSRCLAAASIPSRWSTGPGRTLRRWPKAGR